MKPSDMPRPFAPEHSDEPTDTDVLDWAENNPEQAMNAMQSWWAQAGRGFREYRFNFRGVLRGAMLEERNES